MKLPHKYDKYNHNAYLDKLQSLARSLGDDMFILSNDMTHVSMQNLCLSNRQELKQMEAIIVHLQLALEEILHLRDER